jgi:hypothetical protein
LLINITAYNKVEELSNDWDTILYDNKLSTIFYTNDTTNIKKIINCSNNNQTLFLLYSKELFDKKAKDKEEIEKIINEVENISSTLKKSIITIITNQNIFSEQKEIISKIGQYLEWNTIFIKLYDKYIKLIPDDFIGKNIKQFKSDYQKFEQENQKEIDENLNDIIFDFEIKFKRAKLVNNLVSLKSEEELILKDILLNLFDNEVKSKYKELDNLINTELYKDKIERITKPIKEYVDISTASEIFDKIDVVNKCLEKLSDTQLSTRSNDTQANKNFKSIYKKLKYNCLYFQYKEADVSEKKPNKRDIKNHFKKKIDAIFEKNTQMNLDIDSIKKELLTYMNRIHTKAENIQIEAEQSESNKLDLTKKEKLTDFSVLHYKKIDKIGEKYPYLLTPKENPNSSKEVDLSF